MTRNTLQVNGTAVKESWLQRLGGVGQVKAEAAAAATPVCVCVCVCVCVYVCARAHALTTLPLLLSPKSQT